MEDELKVTMQIGNGPEIPLTGDVEQDARAIAPQLRDAMAGTGLLRSMDETEHALTDELSLAIEDDEYGPKIVETRVTPIEERTKERRLSQLRRRMESNELLDASTPGGRHNLARLKKAETDTGVMLDLEKEFLEEIDRVKNGEWTKKEDYAIHQEAVHITSFVIKTYRRDLIGYRIAVVMAKEIPPVLRRGRLGTATKLPGKMRFLSQWDALLTLDWPRWCRITDRDRQRLIDHELRHLERGEEGQLQLRAHDFEDFAETIRLYGLQSESGIFNTDGRVAQVLRHEAAQLELLPRSA